MSKCRPGKMLIDEVTLVDLVEARKKALEEEVKELRSKMKPAQKTTK